MYRLRTLGGAAVLRDGVLLDSFTGQRKLIALLAVLAVAGRRGISRDRIAALLWPESDMERARGSLKQSLHTLRRQFGTGDVVAGTAELRLNAEHLESDVEEFMTATEAGDHLRAADLYGGPFLDGFHLAGAPEFEHWLDETRAALAHQHADSLATLAGAAQQRGAFGEAATLWRRIQAQDPFSARAMVGLMEALDAGGERSAALRAGQAYETLMREELGVAGDAAVLSLIQRLRAAPSAPPAPSTPIQPATGASTSPPVPPESATGASSTSTSSAEASSSEVAHGIPEVSAAVPRRMRPGVALMVSLALVVVLLAVVVYWQAQPSGGRTQPDAASIAVIPFVNTSDHAENEHFADGLTDELISTLGTVQGIRVAARTSTFALKDRGLSARAFADTLGVATVIEGTVRRQADRVKVTAQLVDPTGNVVLWSESFDRRVEDFIAVQEEIALAIVGVLRGDLPASSSVRRRLPDRATVDAEAYDLYLRGRYNWDLPVHERLHQGVRFHQRAVERDPSFAPAYAGLAESYVNLAIYGYMPPPEALARAQVAADRALALDGDLVEALVARAYVQLSRVEFAGAEADLQRALTLNSNYPWAHHFYSLYLLMAGRPHEAERYNRQALILDPLSLPANATRGVVQAQLGNLAAAERELERALQLRSDFVLTLYYRGVVQAARGDDEAALHALQLAGQQAPDYPGLPGALARTLDRLGRDVEADSIMIQLEQRAATDPRARLNLALAHGAFGRIEDAVAILNDVRWDVPSLIGIRADPLLASLRSDARTARILQVLAGQQVSPK
jgi:TolB-like protein/DNA-binding SARP family transcriptional activator/Flp pilus assembly protein TadD